MEIIIDAYNVLKHMTRGAFSSDAQRALFVRTMAQYAKKRNHSLTLVFDGGPYERPYNERTDGIVITYAGYHQSADEYIKDLVLEKNKQDALVISSDKQLCDFVRSKTHISCIAAHEFIDRVSEILDISKIRIISSQEKARKLAQEDAPELDQLMQEASKKIIIKDETTIASGKEASSTKASKKERHKQLLLKKL